MQIHYTLEDFSVLENAIATIGTFDGVHIGHQKILHTLTRLALERNTPSVLITFWPHPRKILQPLSKENKLLFNLEERIQLFQEFNIDHLIVIPFDIAFSKISPEDFIINIIKNKIGTKTLILGYDHRFGNNREGSFEYLKTNANNYGLELIEIPRQDIDELAISSSRIREAISKADFENAFKLLGHKYSLTGKVVNGEMLGRKLGFPTANIDPENEDKIIPPIGVYAVFVEIHNEVFQGMLNIGTRPTVGGKKQSIEVHLFNFNQNIYQEKIKVIFIKKLREEQKFEGLEALINQLNKDKEIAKKLLSTI
ncbi:MAG: bifunctional riboflavin kinase/FAD synthetase [Cytophagales bacterium]|nr:MAG: bifunctional riboflavin kinase/FAD synthetase [Cytophagales bacterium]